MDLKRYLRRIHYEGSLEPSCETLRALHRAHLLNITYENFDIHLGKSLLLDEDYIYHKIVVQKRGGWCYEMNGLFAWVLRELGFEVRLLAGAVNRGRLGEAARMSHLVLLVKLDRPHLVDVGFGNGFLEPLPLELGFYQQGFLSYRLERLDGEWWRYHNHAHGGPSFDFTLEAYELTDFAEKCLEQQTSPESGFVRVTVCHRFLPEGILSLRGAVLQTITQDGVGEKVIAQLADYEHLLHERFDLPLDNVRPLWEKVWQSHLEWQESLRAKS
jgi:N-hydroxyarylamine O-acetyltransferase